jgi:hypothetical protein
MLKSEKEKRLMPGYVLHKRDVGQDKAINITLGDLIIEWLKNIT